MQRERRDHPSRGTVVDPTELRKPTCADGPALWRLARAAGTLDLNPPYTYLMACRNLSDTSIVAEEEGRVVGFVTGDKPVSVPETLFVWQVTVDGSQRGKGLGRRMIAAVLAREVCADVRFLETNVTPSNAASDRLFRSVADHLEAECAVLPCFPRELFPDAEHEEELLYRIGPFRGGAGVRVDENDVEAPRRR